MGLIPQFNFSQIKLNCTQLTMQSKLSKISVFDQITDEVIFGDQAKIMTLMVENAAIEQISKFLEHPVFKDLVARFMPDAHAGAGCVVGTTVQLGQMIIPNIIGVDIGCGVLALLLSIGEIDYKHLHEFIMSDIPSGMKNHSHPNLALLEKVYNLMLNEESLKKQELPATFTDFCDRVKEVASEIGVKSPLGGLGTLGGGNHFIAVEVSEQTGAKYLNLHSGSRGFGKCVGDHFQKLAEYLIYTSASTYEKTLNDMAHNRSIPKSMQKFIKFQPYSDEIKNLHDGFPKDMAFLVGEHAQRYIKCMKLAQVFALLNRRVMAFKICEHLGVNYEEVFIQHQQVESVHNYIDFADNIIRKGAISARQGEKVIIPLNMKDGSLLGVGKGNDDWNQSAPHGAGRVLSRTKAREVLNMTDFVKSMEGIATWSVCQDTLDEAPLAYKPADYIKKRIADTVEVTDHLRTAFNFKAGGKD